MVFCSTRYKQKTFAGKYPAKVGSVWFFFSDITCSTYTTRVNRLAWIFLRCLDSKKFLLRNNLMM
jgi:hypothetical protein